MVFSYQLPLKIKLFFPDNEYLKNYSEPEVMDNDLISSITCENLENRPAAVYSVALEMIIYKNVRARPILLNNKYSCYKWKNI